MLLLLSSLRLFLRLDLLCRLLRCCSSNKLAAIHRTLDGGSLSVYGDLLLAYRLAILESTDEL